MDYQKIIKNILEAAIQKNASDVHILVGHPPVLRIERKLCDLEHEKEINPEDAKGFAFCLMTNLQQEKFIKDKEIDFAYDFTEKMRFRVNIFFQRQGISIALRIIPSEIKTLEDLNLPPILNKFIEAKQGLVLITGSSSQGKSTTLAALIDAINHQRKEHIITIEDPIEYVFQDDKCIIEQREVHRDTLSFAKALRSALREDPDVIMVGEMRDLETITTTITAAETGHLVFGTLHTNSASQTIHRIIDVFPSHQQNQIMAQLAGSLLGVVSQRLVPKIKEGLFPACEVMFANSAVSNLIRENKIHEIHSIIETSGIAGMFSLNKCLVDLFRRKEISEETAFKYSLNPDDLKARLRI